MEVAQGMSQGQDAIASSSGNATPSASQAPSAPVTSEERTFKQSEVNDIVKRAKLNAVDDFRRLQSEQPAYFAQKYGTNDQTEFPPSQQKQVTSPVSEQEIRRLAAEETQRLRDSWVQEARTNYETQQAQKTVENFFTKVNPGREKYQDFDKVTGNIPLAKFPNVVQILGEHIDNAQDVFYSLGNDPSRLLQLEALAEKDMNYALHQAQRLSQSLKDNDKASTAKVPNPPLSQMRPSQTGTDNGVLSFGDLRRKYRV